MSSIINVTHICVKTTEYFDKKYPTTVTSKIGNMVSKFPLDFCHQER